MHAIALVKDKYLAVLQIFDCVIHRFRAEGMNYKGCFFTSFDKTISAFTIEVQRYLLLFIGLNYECRDLLKIVRNSDEYLLTIVKRYFSPLGLQTKTTE